MQEKFKHIFGITRSLPDADLLESESGLFLDELESLNLNWLDAPFTPEAGGVYDIMKAARASALRELETTLLASVFAKSKTTLPAFYGKIGQDTFRGLGETPSGELSLTLKRKQFAPNNSVSIKLKRIGLIMDSEGTFDVTIPETGTTVQVVCAARTPSYYIFPKDQQPVFKLNGEDLVVSYDPQDATPLSNITSCGCGLLDANLSKYFDSVIGQAANGLILDVQIDCDPVNILNVNGEQKLSVFNVYAAAARFKAAELLIDRVIASDAINRNTLLDLDYMKGRKATFRREFMDRINWLSDPDSDSISLALDPCYTCKNESGFQKVGILKTW